MHAAKNLHIHPFIYKYVFHIATNRTFVVTFSLPCPSPSQIWPIFKANLLYILLYLQSTHTQIHLYHFSEHI